MQPSEKRKNIRRTITYPAFIDLGDGQPARECTLCDASQEGAQLAVAEPSSVPDDFILALSSDGAARRRCRVVWRTETQIGVAFLKDGKKGQPAMRVPPAALSAASLSDEAAPEAAPDRVDVDNLSPR